MAYGPFQCRGEGVATELVQNSASVLILGVGEGVIVLNDFAVKHNTIRLPCVLRFTSDAEHQHLIAGDVSSCTE